MVSNSDLVIQRVNENKCPVCVREFKKDDDLVFEDFNGTKQPVHKEHIKYERATDTVRKEVGRVD